MRNHVYKVHTSKRYAFLMGLIFITSAIVLSALTVGLFIRLGLMAIFVIYGVQLFRRYVLLRDAKSILALQYMDDRRWMLQTSTHQYEAELLGDSTITTLISILRFRIKGFRFPWVAIVLPDSLQPDEYRALLKLITTL